MSSKPTANGTYFMVESGSWVPPVYFRAALGNLTKYWIEETKHHCSRSRERFIIVLQKRGLITQEKTRKS
jgi:hypothetical protein